jgi:hypothetical protein
MEGLEMKALDGDGLERESLIGFSLSLQQKQNI